MKLRNCCPHLQAATSVTVVDRTVAQRWQKTGNHAVRFCPIASNCAFCSSLSVA